MSYYFDRPVFILAAPRSGSTLLFETLMQSESLWTIGDESHALIEGNPRFRPGFGFCDSNRLTEKNLDNSSIDKLRTDFLQALRNRAGENWSSEYGKPRMLEKTPKNSLRIPMLKTVFPDARFIYLYRDARENISSIIEAWRSGRFVTYPLIAGKNFPWSLLLPAGWQQMVGRPVEELAAFQWNAANSYIIDDLSSLEKSCWTAVSYSQLIGQPAETIRHLCDFMEVSYDEHLDSVCSNGLRLSRYTVTPPAADKWKKNAVLIERVMPVIRFTEQKIQAATAG